MTPSDPWSDLRSEPALTALLQIAKSHRLRVWLTGGTLRDLLLGMTPPDLDLAVSGDALALGRDLAAAVGARFVPLKETMATCRVVLEPSGQRYLDLVGLRAPTLEDDLRARDFTVNALAMPLAGALSGVGRVIDPTGGRADLKARRLRLAGPGSLLDDPLRVLRAFRFMATHGLAPEPGLMDALQAAAPGLFRVARERVGQEWRKLMAGPWAGAAAAAMDQAQVLTRLLPEMAPGRGLEQNPFHHLTVLEHNLAALEALERVLAEPEAHLGPLAGQTHLFHHDQRRRWQLMTAVLWHDLGKPATRRHKGHGWASFYRHDLEGAILALGAARRLGLSKAESAAIAGLVRQHMRPFHLLGVSQRVGLSRRAVRRLLAAVGEDLAGVFLLGLADTMAGRGPQRPPEAEQRLLALWAEVERWRLCELDAALAAPPLINGRDLMAGLDLGPGPEVGRLLGLVREAQLNGEVQDAGAALKLARRLYDQRRGHGR